MDEEYKKNECEKLTGMSLLDFRHNVIVEYGEWEKAQREKQEAEAAQANWEGVGADANKNDQSLQTVT